MEAVLCLWYCLLVSYIGKVSVSILLVCIMFIIMCYSLSCILHNVVLLNGRYSACAVAGCFSPVSLKAVPSNFNVLISVLRCSSYKSNGSRAS